MSAKMSANALIVAVLFVLVAAAAAARIVTGPIVHPAAGGSLYAMGKVAPLADALGEPVELAVSDKAPGR